MISINIDENTVSVFDGKNFNSSPRTKGLNEKEQYLVSLASFLGFEPHEILNLSVSEEELRIISYNEFEDEIDYSVYDDMDISELEFELEDLVGSISNERLWQKGCDTRLSIWLHEQNIKNLTSRVDYVKDKLKEMQNKKPSLDDTITSAYSRAEVQRIDGSEVKNSREQVF